MCCEVLVRLSAGSDKCQPIWRDYEEGGHPACMIEQNALFAHLFDNHIYGAIYNGWCGGAELASHSLAFA